jgi:hypothetical protein
VERPLEKAVKHAAAAPLVVPLIALPELGHDVLLPDGETLQPQEKTKKMPHRLFVLQMPHAGDKELPGRLFPGGKDQVQFCPVAGAQAKALPGGTADFRYSPRSFVRCFVRDGSADVSMASLFLRVVATGKGKVPQL